MSDDKDDLNGFDGLGKTNDDGMHFSEEELEAAMAGFEKEFQDEEAAQQNAMHAAGPLLAQRSQVEHAEITPQSRKLGFW